MTSTIKRRLLNLEQHAKIIRDSIEGQKHQAIFDAMSADDIHCLMAIVERGLPFSMSTPEEQAAVDRWEAELRKAGLL